MAGFGGDVWGANGGSDTPISGNESLMEAMSRCQLPANTPVGIRQRSYLAELSIGMQRQDAPWQPVDQGTFEDGVGNGSVA